MYEVERYKYKSQLKLIHKDDYILYLNICVSHPWLQALIRYLFPVTHFDKKDILAKYINLVFFVIYTRCIDNYSCLLFDLHVPRCDLDCQLDKRLLKKKSDFQETRSLCFYPLKELHMKVTGRPQTSANQLPARIITTSSCSIKYL